MKHSCLSINDDSNVVEPSRCHPSYHPLMHKTVDPTQHSKPNVATLPHKPREMDIVLHPRPRNMVNPTSAPKSTKAAQAPEPLLESDNKAQQGDLNSWSFAAPAATRVTRSHWTSWTSWKLRTRVKTRGKQSDTQLRNSSIAHVSTLSSSLWYYHSPSSPPRSRQLSFTSILPIFLHPTRNPLPQDALFRTLTPSSHLSSSQAHESFLVPYPHRA